MPDVRIAVVPFDSPIVATSIDVTDAGGRLGGLVPEAVIIFSGEAPNDGTPATNAMWLEGFAVNGGNQRGASGWSEHNQINTDDNAMWSGTNIIVQAQGVNFASVTAWISNGITLTFANAGATPRKYFAVLIAGADVSAYVGTLDMTSAWTAAQDITAPGFAPELVFIAQCHTTSVNQNTLVTTHFHQGWGVAKPLATSPQTTQYRAVALAEGDLQSSAVPGMQARNDCAAMAVGAAAALSWQLYLESFDAQGFSARTSASVGAGTIRVFYLALNLGGLSTHIGDFNARATTGQQAYTGLGFQPQAVLVAGGGPTTINTAEGDTVGASGLAFGAFDAQEEWAHSGRIRFNADPTDTDKVTLAAAMLWPNSTDVDATVASLVSLDPDGFTLDYTAVSGRGELALFVAFAEGDGLVADNVRVSQTAILYLAALPSRPRVSQVAVLVLASFAPCATYRVRGYKMTRLDGTLFAYTDHDQDLEAMGVTFKACASLSASATETTAKADETGDTQFTGLFSDDDITEADLYAGLFDGATIEIWELSWNQAADPMPPRRLAAGVMGRVKQGTGRFTAEALSYGGLLQQRPLLETVTPHCRFELFSERCGLNRADWVETGSVTALYPINAFTQARKRLFVDASRGEAADYFDVGKLTWLTGANAGLSSEIKHFESGAFELWEPMPNAIQIGDTYEATPGCDFMRTTCRDKFDNVINFGGFDDIPGTDAITQTPNAKQ